MLGSDHEGERSNAARLATLELRRLGLTWAELIARAFSRPAKVEPKPPPKRDTHQGRPFTNPYTPEYTWQEDLWRRHQEEQPQQRPNPGQRWAERDGYVLWDIVTAAVLSWDSDDLLNWDRTFLTTFRRIGPQAEATAAQWAQLIRIAKKLGLEPVG